MSNTKGKFGIWSQNKSANESDSNTKRKVEDQER